MLLTRLPIVAVGLVGLFWSIWFLIAGSIPVVDSIFFKGAVHQLPFAVSRAYDASVAPVFVFLWVMAWYFANRTGNRDDFVAASKIAGGIYVVSAFSFGFTLLSDGTVVMALIFAVYVTAVATALVSFTHAIFAGGHEEQYKKGVVGCVVGNICLVMAVGLAIFIVLGGVNGLGVMVALAAVCLMLSMLTYSAAYGIKFAVRERRAIAKATVAWLLARDL